MTLDKNGVLFGIGHESGALLLGVASIIGHLSIGVFMIVGRKAVFEGGPRAVQLGQWLKAQTPIFFKKSLASINPHAKEVGKILKALIVVGIRDLEKNARPRIISTGQLMSRQYTTLIVKSRTKRKGKITDRAKRLEASQEEQIKVKHGIISADQPMQKGEGLNTFVDSHED